MNYRQLLSCLVVFLCVRGYGQTHTLLETKKDSLQLSVADTVRIQLLLDIALLEEDSAHVFQWLSQAEVLAKQRVPDAFLIHTYYTYGKVYDRYYASVQSIAYLQKALAVAQSVGIKNEVARIQYSLFAAYSNHGQWDKAMRHAVAASKAYQQLGDRRKQAQAYEAIGTAYYNQIEESEQKSVGAKALSYLQKAQQVYEQNQDSALLARIYNKIGHVYYTQENWKEAKHFFEKSIKAAQQSDSPPDMLPALNNLGNVYQEQHLLDSSVYYYQQALRIAYKEDLPHSLVKSYHSLARLYIEAGKMPQARVVLDSSLYLAKKLAMPALLKNTYYWNYMYFLKQNRYKEALENYSTYQYWIGIIYDQTKNSTINELQIQYETEKKEHQIASLEKEVQIRQIMTGIAIAAVVMTIVCLVLLYRSYRLQKELAQRRQEMIQQEKQQHILEKRLEEQEKLRLQAEIDMQKRELITSTLHVQQKNELLAEVQQTLTGIQSDAVYGNDIRKINQSIRQNIRFDGEWEKAKTHFEQVHPLFFSKLQALCPHLTENELKHCAYIKMNLSIKEVANLVSVEASSVKVSRYRIKKKLNLDAETDMGKFLLEL